MRSVNISMLMSSCCADVVVVVLIDDIDDDDDDHECERGKGKEIIKEKREEGRKGEMTNGAREGKKVWRGSVNTNTEKTDGSDK